MKKLILLVALELPFGAVLRAELKLPAIIGDHMVLQQKQSNPVWGWDDPGTKITVSFAGRDYSTTAAADGKWIVRFVAQPANSTPTSITIAGTSRREIQDVLIGEVWMCSGQSNMGFTLTQDWNGDLEAAASDLPRIRLITAPLVGTQELQTDYKEGEASHWRLATPATALRFSAIGFLYGRYLHQILHVPGDKAAITFEMFGSSLRAFDVAEAKGFALCGADRVWHWATAKVVGKDTVEVRSDEVAAPVAVRYAWADNPVFNLFSNDGLPVTPFRTDDYPMITTPKPGGGTSPK